MLTGGQASSLSTAAGGFSPTACDLEPNNWLNLSPIEGLGSLEPPNMLPPPQPASRTPATASASATRRWRTGPASIVRIVSSVTHHSVEIPTNLCQDKLFQTAADEGARRAL